MRLSFPNGDHADVLVGEGSVRIGGAADNDVVVAELRDRHARVIRDARGIVLEIVDPGARAHVNARPVREKAFLRYGDTLCLEAVTIALSQPEADESESVEPMAATGTTRGVLRGMSGSWFGKSITLGDGLVLSMASAGGIRVGDASDAHVLARVDVDGGQPQLFSSEAGGSLVNGVRRERATLRTGDQLTFGRDRFVVECCSSLPRPRLYDRDEATDGVESTVADVIPEKETVSSAIWWLIAAAAAMGLALAVVLARGT